MYYLIKVLLSAIFIVVITEFAKVNATLGGLIKSLPLISLISILWIYFDTHNTEVIADLSISTFWFVLPTLPMFLILPYLLKHHLTFYLSLAVSIAAMLILYVIMTLVLKEFGYKL